MSASLVGSEMCIRDSFLPLDSNWQQRAVLRGRSAPRAARGRQTRTPRWGCLLYTSDAADDM
eukprot:4231994-Alexandrium_andersonii.AAC.1